MTSISDQYPVLDTENIVDPIAFFNQWYHEATLNVAIRNPGAMCLSTVDEHGYPDARLLLYKPVDNHGFSFFTHSTSPKIQQAMQCRRVALTFYWEIFGRQVRILGEIEELPVAVADRYFASRPRYSQIGAWASSQSTPLESRQVLADRMESFEAKFFGKDVPRPLHWNGYVVKPIEIEFWQEHNYRLHDRIRCVKSGDGWEKTRLYP